MDVTTRIRSLLEERTFLTNAGTETYLIFQQGFDLPEFCAFTVFDDADAWAALERDFIGPTLAAAAEHGCGMMIDALLWRAHPDFIVKVGREASELAAVTARAVAETRAAVDRWRQANGHDAESLPVLVVADVGPRGDGYKVEDADVTVEAARDYHRVQLRAVAEAGVDVVCALTMTSLAEATGIVEAARECDLPIIVSPTVETDGKLPDGSTLGSFIEQVDAATGGAPLFYMVNCAHPTHLRPTLDAARAAGDAWLGRFRGFRANASTKSHEELDDSTELDRGDVTELAEQLATMRKTYGLRVIGGCCGTDHEHLAAVAALA